MENLSGKRFGKLVVSNFVERRNDNYYWRCVCDCGSETIMLAGNIKRGTQQCKRCARPIKHGHSSGHQSKTGRSPTYISWLAMFTRVKGKSEKLLYSYKHVSICERWKSFENFLSDMGERPSSSHTLDRINNCGNYEPDNCRWADWSTQMGNRRQRRDQVPKQGNS